MNYEEIIKDYGTPTYVYDIAKLQRRVQYIRSKLNSNYKLIYAVKANTFILPKLENFVDGYEICSFGEFEICKKLNLNQTKFLISGVYKNKKEIEYMVSECPDVSKYTIESWNQYELLKELTEKYQKEIQVLIRLTSGNQFGVSESDFEKIVEANSGNKYIHIVGIEYFTGTQKHSLKKINREIDYLISFIESIEEKYPIELCEVEYGTGSPVFYFQGEEFDEDNYFKELNLALGKIKNRKISLEVGRSIAASCGSFFTSVVDMKHNKNGNIALLDGGINQLVYYGQTMAMRIPYFDIYPKRSGELIPYNLYGSLCTVNDIIIKNITVNQLETGDVFIFKNVGAYSATEGIALFLSRDLPKVVICDENEKCYMVRNSLKTSEPNFPKYDEKEM